MKKKPKAKQLQHTKNNQLNKYLPTPQQTQGNRPKLTGSRKPKRKE